MAINGTKSLKRTKQCAKCPWKKKSNSFDIPRYDLEKHKNLSCTIAKDEEIYSDAVRAMACHESPVEEPYYCVGWLLNQLGPGNNIPLRMLIRKYSNAKDLRVFGPQHERFEDTIPD